MIKEVLGQILYQYPLWEFAVKRKKDSIKGVNIRAVFSSNLRRLRTMADLTQVKLAEKANLAPNFINDIENGKKWVSPESLGKIAGALKAEPYQFFISNPNWNNQGAELFSIFLNDIEDTLKKVSLDYRDRFIPAFNREDESDQSIKSTPKKGK